jgi:probable rRNA maturation factor
MTIEVQVDPPFSGRVDPNLLREAARAALGETQAELTIRIGTDAAIRSLNRQFMGTDTVTDILSFPTGDGPDDPDGYLGDILIAFPQAEKQAASGGHPVEKELQLLVVHGILHLLGHDHAVEDEKGRMWARQAEILKRLGNSLSPP